MRFLIFDFDDLSDAAGENACAHSVSFEDIALDGSCMAFSFDNPEPAALTGVGRERFFWTRPRADFIMDRCCAEKSKRIQIFSEHLKIKLEHDALRSQFVLKTAYIKFPSQVNTKLKNFRVRTIMRDREGYGAVAKW